MIHLPILSVDHLLKKERIQVFKEVGDSKYISKSLLFLTGYELW